MDKIIERISEIHKRISHAAMRGGLQPERVRLVAVSKTVDVDAVREAYDAGQRVFGENRIQEARRKAEDLSDLNISWHMVGHLQRNKAKVAVGLFDLIHSVDSAALLDTINRHASEMDKVQDVLLQVKLSEEESKTGATIEALDELVETSGKLDNINVCGLMTVPPFFDAPERVRPYFKRLRELNEGYGFSELSMGMTGDFEVAVEEGATLVRIGTAIFGERIYK
jgi:hypothetical protein